MIDLNKKSHIVYWTKHLSVNEWQLRNIVVLAGPLIADVKEFIKRYEQHAHPPPL